MCISTFEYIFIYMNTKVFIHVYIKYIYVYMIKKHEANVSPATMSK